MNCFPVNQDLEGGQSGGGDVLASVEHGLRHVESESELEDVRVGGEEVGHHGEVLLVAVVLVAPCKDVPVPRPAAGEGAREPPHAVGVRAGPRVGRRLGGNSMGFEKGPKKDPNGFLEEDMCINCFINLSKLPGPFYWAGDYPPVHSAQTETRSEPVGGLATYCNARHRQAVPPNKGPKRA